MTGPGMTGPGMTGPGMTGPGMTDPGLTGRAPFDETDRLVEPHVRTVSRVLHGRAVVEIGVVEVVVSPEIGRLSHAAALVSHHVLESAVLGPVGVVVAQVPFAEHGGAVAGRAENVRHGRLRLAQDGPAPAGRPSAVAHGPPAGHQGAARRRAQGRHVEVGQEDRVIVKGVDTGCLQPRMSGASQVAVALVVRDDQDDIGSFVAHPDFYSLALRKRCDTTDLITNITGLSDHCYLTIPASLG